MTRARWKLLVLPVAGVLSAARCHFPPRRTLFQPFGTMASPDPEPPRRVRKKEPLRLIRSKESRSKRPGLDGPATVFLQVLGAGSRDNPASVYVFSEFNR